jgi:hypothetical protein
MVEAMGGTVALLPSEKGLALSVTLKKFIEGP